MTTRATSRKAYEELVASGKLVGQQASILLKLITLGNAATSGEVLEAMEIHNRNAWRARFTELQARGLIQEIDERRCKVSGRLSIVWEYTGRTKPLDVKRGHRVDGAAWKALALELWKATIKGMSTHDHAHFRERFEAMK